MNEDKSKGRITVYVIVFLLLAAVLVGIIVFGLGHSASSGDDGHKAEVTDTSGNAQYLDNWETEPVTEPAETKPKHESPLKMVVAEAETELTDLGVELDRNSKKTYKMDLDKFADPGDTIDSFTFYYHAADGVSGLGEVKGGFGISVDNKCEAKTDNIWYQTPEDFSVRAGTSGSVTWVIPDEILDYVTVPRGSILFGYWWSDVEKIVLDRVVCHKRAVQLIPCDGESGSEINKVIKPAEPDNVISVDVSEILETYHMPCCLTMKFEGSEPVSELKGKFTIDTGNFRGGTCESVPMIVSSEKNETELMWVLPEVIRLNADHGGRITFTLERCSLSEVTAKELVVEYALNE
ncbi:MAG: DUF5620 domain-containing protein [Oscillospiraceae bacterium]|nr:DUF5620 domain-containing protein [Oscillospiraceae bacterium]